MFSCPWKQRRTTCLALLLVLVMAGPASAHALGVECRIRGGHVELEAYYDDDTPARNAKVSVLDDQKNPVVQGRTNDQGRWAFPVPKPGKYEVVVDAGAGHRATAKITVPADQKPSGASDSTSASDVTLIGQREEQRPSFAASPLISGGPTRQEFSRFPWFKVGLGLAAITAFGLAFRLARRAKRASSGIVRPPDESRSGAVNLAREKGDLP